MRLKTDKNSFIRFLKDEKFIEWKLFPTEELNRYWEEYLREHPAEKDDIQLAESHFKNINVSSVKMPFEKKKKAMERLEQSLAAYTRHTRRRKITRLAYAAAACAATVVLTVFYIQRDASRSDSELIASTEYIVGNELESEDILFITGSKTTSFQSDVDILIDNDQTIQVKSEDKEAEKISIEQHTMNKLVVPYGKRSKITLADGTRVWLNSGSTLEFPSAFATNKREVHLLGEMYIEVAPDKSKSFYVRTSGYDVRVYGTKFNVSTYSGASSSVVLVEGSVSLQSAGGQELFLSPSEQAVYSEATGAFDLRSVDVDAFISWKDGYLTFKDTPVIEALKQIERYYNLSFDYGAGVSLRGLTCTGKIILSDNVDNVMTALTLISGTKYKKEDKIIYIYKE